MWFAAQMHIINHFSVDMKHGTIQKLGSGIA
jgi:hypothetical protein